MKDTKSLRLRSFLGSFLGAVCAIWPAATWNEPSLLLFGGTIGWVAGYHGGLLYASAIRGWRYARRSGFKMSFWATAKMLGVQSFLRNASENVRKSWAITCSILQYEIPLKKLSLGLLGAFSRGQQSIVGTVSLPRRFRVWQSAHEMNRATAIRFFAICVGAMSFTSLVWLNFLEMAPEVGSIMKGTENGSVVTVGYIYLQSGMLTFIFGLFPAVVALTVFVEESSSQRGFYSIWERYGNRGAVLFAFGETIRYIWTLAWIYFTVVATLFLIIPIAFLGLIIGGLACAGMLFAIRLAWRAMRINRTYGFVSLGTAIFVGVVTFYAFRAELVADPAFRLVVSVMAGTLAGAVSVAIDYLCGVVFKSSITIRRLALREKKREEISVLVWFFETLPATLWRLNSKFFRASLSIA